MCFIWICFWTETVNKLKLKTHITWWWAVLYFRWETSEHWQMPSKVLPCHPADMPPSLYSNCYYHSRLCLLTETTVNIFESLLTTSPSNSRCCVGWLHCASWWCPIVTLLDIITANSWDRCCRCTLGLHTAGPGQGLCLDTPLFVRIDLLRAINDVKTFQRHP